MHTHIHNHIYIHTHIHRSCALFHNLHVILVKRLFANLPGDKDPLLGKPLNALTWLELLRQYVSNLLSDEYFESHEGHGHDHGHGHHGLVATRDIETLSSECVRVSESVLIFE